MRYVFADIDGVLNFWGWHEPHLAKVQPFWTGRRFEPAMVARMNRITEVTGAHIVVISSWRRQYELAELADILRQEASIAAPVDGCTPQLRSWKRGEEIAVFLLDHPCDSFVVIDDERAGLDAYRGRLVSPQHGIGLSDLDADLAIRILMQRRVSRKHFRVGQSLDDAIRAHKAALCRRAADVQRMDEKARPPDDCCAMCAFGDEYLHATDRAKRCGENLRRLLARRGRPEDLDLADSIRISAWP